MNNRDGREMSWIDKTSPNGRCLTSKGEVGKCATFKECYPYFKIPDLGALDGWVLGVYDTCSYSRGDKLAFGVCCSAPLTTPKPDYNQGFIIEEPQVKCNNSK